MTPSNSRNRPAPWAPISLIAIALAVYLPGLFSTPPIDRDEARFAQASRQMLESVTLVQTLQDPALHTGGLAVPMVQSRPRLNKPPLIYWLQSLSVFALTAGDVLRDAIWMYRVPSVLGAISAVLAVWWMGRRMGDARAAWLAGVLLATCVVVVFDAHQARADQVLLGVTTWAMALLWNVLRRARLGKRVGPWRWLTLWLVVGLGVLAKGLTPLVVLSTLGALTVVTGSLRDWRAAKPMLGLLVVAAVVAPWVLAVAGHVGFERYLDILLDEVVARGAGAKEGHAGPPGYYAITAAAAFWPASALTILGVWWGAKRALKLGPKGARWKGRTPGEMPELFLLAWLLPTWVFFEVYSTKLPHYTLPAYPALALLCARAALSGTGLLTRWPARVSVFGFAAVGVLVPSALIAGSIAMPGTFPSPWLVAPLALAVVVLTALATRQLWRGRAPRALALALPAMLPMAVLLHAVVLPRLTDLSPRAMALVQSHVGGERPFAATGYTEDSLVYLTRGTLTKLRREEAEAWLRETPGALLLCRTQDREALETSLGGPLHVLGSVTGFHFARGKPVTLELIERAP